MRLTHEEASRNTKVLMALADELSKKWDYDYATFCEEVAEWGKENDKYYHDGVAPSDKEIEYARKRFKEIRFEKCKCPNTVLSGSEPHFEPRTHFEVPVECPDCGRIGKEIYVVDRIEGFPE